jgi:hypothetical protein
LTTVNVEILNNENSLDRFISDEKKDVAYKTVSAKNLAGWVGGWVGGWLAGKAGLRIAYSNKKLLILYNSKLRHLNFALVK